jgi:uncharacterized repeat protein (TIGR01451 family)
MVCVGLLIGSSVATAQTANLSVSKSAPGTASVGVNFSYTITVVNNGPNTATGVTVTDVLPPNVNFVPAGSTAGCASNAGTVTCPVGTGTLGSGGSSVVTIVANSTVSGAITNVVGVIAKEADGTMSNNSATQTLTVATAGPNALFLSEQAPPRTMPPSLTVPVFVAMQNSGSLTWTLAQAYRLGSQNPDNNTTWGLDRVDLSSGDSIAAGQSKTFLFNATAPATPGIYPFQWRMLQEGVVWFGDITPNSPVDVGGKRLYALTPCRVLDTRNSNGPYGGPAIPALGSRTFAIGGQCAVALAARSVAINVTVVAPGATGEFRIAPSDAAGQASVVEFTSGITRAANTTASLSLTSPGSLTIVNGTGIATNVVVDVYGYFQ